MLRFADAMKTARTAALLGAAGVAAAVALGYFSAPARSPRASEGRAAAGQPGASFAPATLPGTAPQGTPLPASLAGSTPPRLPLDAHGRLARTRAVRDFFDYFLTAQHEMPAKTLDAAVRRQIAAQLDGTAAEFDALDAWRRYLAYRDALARLAPLTVPSSSGPNLDAMQASLDERASLASRTMGAEWSEAFFGADWRRDRHALARLRITTDATLTDAQKDARLEALDETLPPEERAALQRERRTRATLDTIATLQNQGMSLDDLRARATQTLGAQAAERIVRVQEDEDAWRAKYADYAAQRARIDAMGLPPADREAQIAQLRRHMFANPGEAVRAASLDRGP